MELRQTQSLKQTLSPQMLQSMKILQMGMQDLRGFILDIVQENPVLESNENDIYTSTNQNSQVTDWASYFDCNNSYFYKQDKDDNSDFLDKINSLTTQLSLTEYLWAQFVCSELPNDIVNAIHFLILRLDKDGFLTESLEQLSSISDIKLNILQEALTELQKAEPAGVGAFNLRECLLIQLKRKYTNSSLEIKLISDYLPELSTRKFKYLSSTIGVSEKDIKSAYAIISQLNPHPGAGFSDDEKTQFITPDVFIRTVDNKPEIICNNAYIPTITINPYYTKLLSDTSDSEVKSYLEDKCKQAKWVVGAIEQRQNTLLSCIREIVSNQHDYFCTESTYLSPMSLSDIALAINVHESTVSRAIKDKYIQCSKGVFPVSHFLTRGYTSKDGKNAISSCSIKELLKTYLNEESKKKPLSDQKLSEMLLKDGYNVSRRTITKYREELGIPTASGRKAV